MPLLNKCMTILSMENILSLEDENVDLHVYFTVSMAIVNYFGTQIPDIEKIDGQMKTDSTDLH